MDIFKWLFRKSATEENKADFNKIDYSDIQIPKDSENEGADRLSFIDRVKDFKRRLEASDAYKHRDSNCISEEVEVVYLKEWSDFEDEAERLESEQTQHFVWAKVHKDFRFEQELRDNYFRFPYDKIWPYENPYELNIATRQTKLALENDWPSSALRQECIELIDVHFHTIKVSFRDAVEINKYGLIEHDKRINEFRGFLMATKVLIKLEEFSSQRFASKKFREQLDEQFCLGAGFLPQNDLFEYVKTRIREEEDGFTKMGFSPDSYPSDGIDFEYWVKTQLDMFGWAAEVTRASSDQGVDILARKGGLIVAIQCKRFSKPVGNKAIQEVSAGARHYMADVGVVISTSHYTKSAQQLAKTNNVYLLSVDDIPDLYALINA